MALLHRMSEECVKSELDLFTLALTQTAIEKSTYIEIPPLSALTDRGPIEFFVSASSEDYMDLNNTYLHLRVKITNPDGMVENNEGLKGYLCHMFGIIVEINRVHRRGRALSLCHS